MSPLRLLNICTLILAVFQVIKGQSVDFPPQPFLSRAHVIRIAAQNGNILVNKTPYFNSWDETDNPLKATKAFSMEYGWQMLGGKEWHQTCRYPRLGIGTQYMRVMKRDELGHPFSVYGFYDGNYFWSKNFQWTNRMAIGFAFGLARYNPDDSLPNDVISSKLNAFAELGSGFAIKLSDFIFLEPGFRFNHFSNGNIRKPQRGINIISYNVGLRFLLEDPVAAPLKIPIEPCQHRHEVLAYLGMAPRQIEFKDETNEYSHQTYGLNYLMANLHLGYHYEVSCRIKLGGGVDVIYDGTNGQVETAVPGTAHKAEVPLRDKMGLSIFIGGENAIDRLSVITNLGYMVARIRFEYSTPAFEQRLGLKYHIYPNVFAGVNIRAYKFRAAKAIEFNIGIRRTVFRKKSKMGLQDH